MGENPNLNRKIVPHSGGIFGEVTNRFRLISRLIMDGRVNPLIKLLPVATLAYIVIPIDLLPVNPIDDAVVLWLGTTLFVELCPPAVVQEHMESLNGTANTGQSSSAAPSATTAHSTTPRAATDDVVDGEYFETDTQNSQRNRYP